MTQILVTLDNGADADLLQRMIQNMKGVLNTTLSRTPFVKKEEEEDGWFDKLESLRRGFDPSYIDMDDERTRYIMSK